MVVPVFMNVWAGSWLIASVFIERTMQMSSATDAEVRKDLADLLPDSPNFLKACCGPKQLSFCALELGDRLALGERLGHRLAVHLRQLRLVVERFEVRRAAGHVEVDDALGLGRDVQRVDDARPDARFVAPAAPTVSRLKQRRQSRQAEACSRTAQKRAAGARHFRRSKGSSFALSCARDGFVQIQDDASHRGPGGQFARSMSLGTGRARRCSRVLGRLWIRPVFCCCAWPEEPSEL